MSITPPASFPLIATFIHKVDRAKRNIEKLQKEGGPSEQISGPVAEFNKVSTWANKTLNNLVSSIQKETEAFVKKVHLEGMTPTNQKEAQRIKNQNEEMKLFARVFQEFTAEHASIINRVETAVSSDPTPLARPIPKKKHKPKNRPPRPIPKPSSESPSRASDVKKEELATKKEESTTNQKPPSEIERAQAAGLAPLAPIATEESAVSLHRLIDTNNIFELRAELTKNPASIDKPNREGLTPLMHAATLANARGLRAIKLLLERGANINATVARGENKGFTALHFAAKTNALYVNQLLDKKAEVNARADNGLTPLDCATTQKEQAPRNKKRFFETIVNKLVSKGGVKGARLGPLAASSEKKGEKSK